MTNAFSAHIWDIVAWVGITLTIIGFTSWYNIKRKEKIKQKEK